MGKVLGALLLTLALTTPVLADDDPVALAAQGAALQDAGEWIQAREVYEQLEKIRGQENRALYFQAFAASQAGEYDEALTLAQRATQHKGPYRQQAKLLYADMLSRLGEHQRAKDFYVGLQASAAGDERTLIDRRLAALDKHLGTTSPTPTTTPPPTKISSGESTYDAAKAAFNANDLLRSLQLAQRAATLPGSRKLDAKFLYADTLYRMADYKRAKGIYIGLHRSTSGMHRREAERRLATVNVKLGLDARDGLDLE